ncbi:MAG: hypothetical protein V3V23_01510 [Dehalococcoidales bacterium]
MAVASNGGKDSDTGGPEEGTTDTSETNTTFNITDAKALLAQEETVTAASVRKRSADGRSLCTYKIVNQGLERPLTREESLERAKARARAGVSAREGQEDAGTNLLAVDEEGNA